MSEPHHPHPAIGTPPEGHPAGYLGGKSAIAVLTPHILVGLGFRTILEKIAPPCEIAVFDDFAEFEASDPARYAHYFASTQLFALHRDFFLANARHTILLGRGSAPLCDRIRQVDIFRGEEQLVRELIHTLREAHRPDHTVRRTEPTTDRPALTPREVEVLTLVARGLLNKEIADRLQIGVTTVISHRRNLMQKLGVRSAAALVICAVGMGYADESDLDTPHPHK